VKVRTKLFAAQLPLVAALAIAIIVGSGVTRALGRGSGEIMKDNYRSVLASQRMKEYAERIDSGVMFAVAGRPDQGGAQIDANIPPFERELAAQRDNITEPGEREATQNLAARWAAYSRDIAAVRPVLATADLPARYFPTLLPEFLAVKDAADAILAMNQDAMIRKSDSAQRLAGESNTLLVAISVLGLVLAVVASSVMTTRVLRPLGVVAATARRLGEGDVLVRAQVTSRDEVGELARELNTMADHLERYRKSSLGDLLEAQLAAQATIDSLPDAVLVIGLDGSLRHANQAAESILKVDPATPNALAMLEPNVRAVVEKLRAHVAGGHGAYVANLEEAVAVGTRALLPRAAPLYAEEGDVIAATIVLQDVTRLRRFEELRNDLVATVAHELRTPLTSLRMAIHLLCEQQIGALNDKQADLAFAAREDCDRLQSIVDELLDLSRIQADRMELRLAPLDPEALIDASHHDARVRVELLPGMPPIRADRERLVLVLDNLISNAIRYGGGSDVIVRAREDGAKLRVEVVDHGPGVPAEYQQAIFDKYVRVPGAPPGGAGIGLYIAREIVRAHGGDIGVESSSAQTMFWFTVPLAL
jgi:signal transduction histidine kinase